MLHDEIKLRDEKIQELRAKLSKLEINLSESQFDKELFSRRMDTTQAQTKVYMIDVEVIFLTEVMWFKIVFFFK